MKKGKIDLLYLGVVQISVSHITEIFNFSDDLDVFLPPPQKLFKSSEFEEYVNCDDNQPYKSNEHSFNSSTSFALSSNPDNVCLPSTSARKYKLIL